MLASFQIEDYHINKLSVEIFPAPDSLNVELQYYASYQAEYKEGKWRGEVNLGFRQLSVDDPKTQLCEATISGHFSMPGDESDEEKETFEQRLKLNGASTLIPIVRAALTSAVAVMGYPNRYTLPNLNVHSFQWKEAVEG